MIKKIDNILKNHKLSFLLASLIYISNDTLLFGTNSNKLFVNIHYMYIVVLAIILLLISIKKNNLKAKLCLIFIIFTLFSTLTMIFKDVISFKYIYELLLIFVSMMFANLWPRKKVFEELSNVLSFVSLMSLVPFLLNIIHQPFLNYFPTFTNIAGYKYHNLFFGFVPFNTYLFNIYRNISFFRESGIFGCFLNLNLFLILYENEHKNLKRLILNIIVTITTMSTGSIICMMFLLFIYFVYQKVGLRKILIFIIICTSFFVITSSDYLNTSIFGKLNSNNASLYSRIASITSNLKISINNPFFGVGWDNIKNDFENISVDRYGSAISHGEKNYHNTNTLLKVLSIHGIMFFIIYIIGFLKFIKSNKNKEILPIFLFIGLVLMFSYEDLTLNFIVPLIVFFGIKCNEGDVINESS